MKKRWLVAVCLCLLCVSFCLVSCNTKTTDGDETMDSESPSDSIVTTPEAISTEETPVIDPAPLQSYRFTPETKGIKVLGVRNESGGGWIGADWTCSGIEFTAETTGGTMTFLASASDRCYFRAYVDGQAWMKSGNNPYYRVGTSDSEIILPDIPAGKHLIRLVKVTGHTLARAQIIDVTFHGTILETAPADQDLYIEFVGDSISCGWGMIGPKDGTYAAQDGSLAFPYLTAQAMNADYSITALSGQGLLMGSPGIPAGYLQTSPKRSGNMYDFARKADIVVLNVGTNDCRTGNMTKYNITEEKFYQAYITFLRTVKEKNGSDCRIVCTYNCMNDTFETQLLKAVADLGGAEVGIHTLKFDRTANANGNGHPVIEEQARYAEVLTEFLQNLPEIPEKQSGSGETLEKDDRGMFISWDSLELYWNKES